MKQYKIEMENLHWTQEGKENLIKRVKANSQQAQTFKSRLPFAKYATVAIMICVFSVTAYATGVFQSAVDVLTPLLGGTPVQTEIIRKIGHPIGASDTVDGITISADAIIGDSNNLFIVYSISNADGTPFNLPEGVSANDVFFLEDNGIQIPFYTGGMHGSIGVDSVKDDGSLQIIEKLSFDKALPIGKNVTSKFSKLSYFNNKGTVVTLSDATWKLRYELNCEDNSMTIPVEKPYKRDNLTYFIDSVVISPIALTANYSVNALMTNNASSGKISDEQAIETDKFINSVDLLITKTDGSIIDITESSGASSSEKEGITVIQKGRTLDEIVPLDEIESITIGDILVPLNN